MLDAAAHRIGKADLIQTEALVCPIVLNDKTKRFCPFFFFVHRHKARILRHAEGEIVKIDVVKIKFRVARKAFHRFFLFGLVIDRCGCRAERHHHHAHAALADGFVCRTVAQIVQPR